MNLLATCKPSLSSTSTSLWIFLQLASHHYHQQQYHHHEEQIVIVRRIKNTTHTHNDDGDDESSSVLDHAWTAWSRTLTRTNLRTRARTRPTMISRTRTRVNKNTNKNELENKSKNANSNKTTSGFSARLAVWFCARLSVDEAIDITVQHVILTSDSWSVRKTMNSPLKTMSIRLNLVAIHFYQSETNEWN